MPNFIGELQELLVSRGLPFPVYTELSATGPSHSRTFEIEVVVGHHQAVGIGSTKKIAKTQAAEKMLQLQKGGGNRSEDRQQRPQTNSPPSSASAEMPTNPSSAMHQLHNLAAGKELVYTLRGTTGGIRCATYTIACLFDKLESTGTGRSLDLAKEAAAKDMLELLSLRSSSLNRSEGNRSFYGSSPRRTSTPMVDSSDDDSGVENPEISQLLAHLSDISLAQELKKFAKFEDLFSNFCKTSGYSYSVVDLKSGQRGDDQYRALVQVSSKPTAPPIYVFGGKGTCRDSAREDAMRTTYDYIAEITNFNVVHEE